MELLVGAVFGFIASLFFVYGFRVGQKSQIPQKPTKKRVDKGGFVKFKPKQEELSAGYKAFSPDDLVDEDGRPVEAYGV